MSGKRYVNKTISSKRMMSVIIYGMIFLLSIIAFYFMNTSKAQNILKLTAFIIDEEGKIEESSFELKAPETDDGYIATLGTVNDGFLINKYYVIDKEEFEKIKATNEEGQISKEDQKEEKRQDITESQDTSLDEKNIIEIDEESIVEEQLLSVNLEKGAIEEVDVNSNKQEETVVEEELIEIEAGHDLKLTEEQIESKEVYLKAIYDVKETNGEKLFNKIISYTTEEDKNISIMGYMPQEANIETKKVEKDEVEAILDEAEIEANITAVYDIKIMDNDNKYNPADFEENVLVAITGYEGNFVNIWHVNDDKVLDKIDATINNGKIVFETKEFSLYGIEVQNIEGISEENIEPKDMAKGPTRSISASVDDPDSTLEINDYDSDYYYYMGQNYTGTIAGTNSNTYSSSNLKRVTINYHGFASGETQGAMKGRISVTERQDIVKYIKCLPIVSGNITIELIDNPFMDKPTGYGFGGWTSSSGTITTDSNTGVQTLTLGASGDISVDVYASWLAASVVYVNPDDGNDNLNNGLSDTSPFGSWGKAFEYLTSNNKGNRERNIIVLTGDIDSSINYTTPVTGTVTQVGDVNYTPSTTFTSGGTYIISNTNTGAGSNALTGSGTSVSNTQLSATVAPPATTQWVITQSGNGYTIRNKSNDYYLAYSNGFFSSGLTLQSSSFTWTLNNRRFSCTVSGMFGGSSTYYLRYNNGWTATTTQNQRNTTLLFTVYYDKCT